MTKRMAKKMKSMTYLVTIFKADIDQKYSFELSLHKVYLMNKYEAAYNLMMIISVVDGEFRDSEGGIVLEYLKHTHEPFVGTPNENRMFMDLTDGQLIEHFRDASYQFYRDHSTDARMMIFEGAAKHFYEQSLQSERDACIDYMKRIMIADNRISPEENTYINKLFKLWGMK